MIFTKKPESAKLEIDLKKLTARRDLLSSRLVSAKSAEAAAIEARRNHLIESDDSDTSAGAKLAADIESAARDAAALTDAISALDEKITECRAAIICARESSSRQKRAGEIEAKIGKIEPLAAQAEKQFEALVATLEKIIAAAEDPDLGTREYIELRGHGERLPAASIIGASVAEAIFHTSPDLLTVTKTPAGMFARASLQVMTRRHDGLSTDLPIDRGDAHGFTHLPLSGALTANIVDPLRRAAEEIRDGSRPVVTISPSLVDEAREEPVFKRRRLIFTKPCRWRDWGGTLVETPDSDQTVPEPVAAAAMAVRAAFEHGNKEAEHHLDWRLSRGIRNDSIPSSKDFIELRVQWPMESAA